MNFPFYIARRYFFSRKSHSVINWISAISVGGVTLGTMALICTLSVFNGFQDLMASLFTEFDPQLKVVPVMGKVIPSEDPQLTLIRKSPDVAVATETLEEMALARYQDHQMVVHIKGVDDNFPRSSDMKGILYGNGSFLLHADVIDYGILGIGVAANLGTGLYFTSPLQIFAPRKGERVDMMDPSSSFNMGELNSSGLVFNVGQKKVDDRYILTSLSFARRLLDRQGFVSALELKLKPDVDVSSAKQRLQQLAGNNLKVEDRYEQQEDVFRIMNIEKMISYLFLSFILFIACFNIIGTLSMLIIDKKSDVKTLRSLGADNRLITDIFMLEGRLIVFFGAVFGIILGLVLCWLQQEFGLLKMGNGSGTFIVDAYPVSVRLQDVLVIFFTVIIVGFLCILYPVRYLTNKLL